MEYYLVLKKKEILTYATTWINLEDIMLREISPSLKEKYWENQDGGVGGHTAPPHTTRTDGKSNGKEV